MGTAKNEKLQPEVESKKPQRLTLEQLIAAKERKDQNLLKTAEIEIPSLGGTLLFKRPSDDIIFDMVNIIQNDPDTKRVVDEMAKIIYTCCDQLHDKTLYEEMDVGDPVDVVFSIMDSGDILDVGDKVCNMNSIYSNAEKEVKNA